jgi:hypothetical protein
MLEYFMAIWNILRTFGIFYGHLVDDIFEIPKSAFLNGKWKIGIENDAYNTANWYSLHPFGRVYGHLV